MDYLTWTYFFRRLLFNPSYYELESMEDNQINKYLSDLINKSLKTLEESSVITIGDGGELVPTSMGKIASFYYLSHYTLKMFKETLSDSVGVEELIEIISLAKEFDEFPVRHNEDKINAELSKEVPLQVNSYSFDSPHTKCNLLFQAHFGRLSLPCSDYITDTKSVLDQCLRIMQAALDICADQGWIKASLAVVNLIQMLCQGRWLTDSDLLTMPHIEVEHLARFYHNEMRIDCLPRLIQFLEMNKFENVLENLVGDFFDKFQIREIYQTAMNLPQIEVYLSVTGQSLTGGDKPQSKEKCNEDAKMNKTFEIDTRDEQRVYDLLENEDYVLNLDLKRVNKFLSKKGEFKAYAPKYPKAKDENWVIILGANCANEASSELLGLKRLNSVKTKSNSHLVFKTPSIKSSNGDFQMTLFLMSDVYLGLDQQFELNFKLFKND